MYGYGFSNTFRTIGGISFDADAQAFITAASITDPTQQSAVNQLVVDLKSASIWTKMKAVYPFIGGSASSHKWNLKNPLDTNAAFRLSFAGGWTHSSTGAKPNGTTAYANTFLVPDTHQSLNSQGLGMYITENTVVGNPIQAGAFDAVSQCSLIQVTSSLLFGRMNGADVSDTISGGAGMFDIQRVSASDQSIYKNGMLVKSNTPSGALSYSTVYLGALNLGGAFGYVDSEFRFAYLSSGLNSTEISNLRTSVQTYNTTLSRQI